VTKFSVQDIISSAVESLTFAAAAKNIQFSIDTDSNIGHMTGDQDRVRQVLWNLLTNAVKYTPQNGQVGLNVEAQNTMIEFEVKDTGEGISPEFLPHVFDRFRQEDSSTIRRHGGLGLGLSIVKHLTELHGGGVSATSPGKNLGSTFTVQFPITAAYDDEEEKGTQISSQPEKDKVQYVPNRKVEHGNVLLIDDNEDMLFLISKILERNGMCVKTTASGLEGLRLVSEINPDLILCDISMPEMDGYMFIRELRDWERRKQRRQIPAIALTALQATKTVQRRYAPVFRLFYQNQ